MKKLTIILLICAILFPSCKKKTAKSNNNQNTQQISEHKDNSEKKPEKPLERISFDSESFDLDYTPETAEPLIPARRVSIKAKTISEEEPESCEPGLRDISKYKTSYSKKRMSLKEYFEKLAEKAKSTADLEEKFVKKEKPQKAEKNEEKKAEKKEKEKQKTESAKKTKKKEEKKEFSVYRITPSELSCESKFITIEFTEQITPLEAYKTQEIIDQKGAEIFTIEPPIKGKWKFDATKEVSYEFDEIPDSYTEYKVIINKNFKTPKGQVFNGNSEFKIDAKSRKLKDLSLKTERDYHYSDYTGLPGEQLKKYSIDFRNNILKSDVENNLSVSYLNQNNEKMDDIPFTIDIVDSRYNVKDKATSFIIKLSPGFKIENDMRVKLSYNDTVSNNTTTRTYNSLVPFKITSHEIDFPYGAFYPRLNVYFSQSVDENSVRNAISASNGEIDYDNIRVDSNELHIYNIKVKSRQDAVVTIKNIKSRTGETLSSPSNFTIEGRDFPGYARFIDYDNKMLEAQFDPKLVFEYRNATNLNYKIEKNCFSIYNMIKGGNNIELYDSCGNPDYEIHLNQRRFKEIDLKPYLENGKGHVGFKAKIGVKSYNWSGEEITDTSSNYLNIQVTDLGATVRYGVNKAVVLVTSLSTGKPVKDASVCMLFGNRYNEEQRTEWVLTDENGKAVVPMKHEGRLLYQNYDYEHDYVFAEVKTNDDHIFFRPEGHNYSADAVAYENPVRALYNKQKTFVYTDRKLYKPNETITISGVDKNLSLGKYTPYAESSYTISLEDDSYYDPTVYKTVSGKTSPNGTFKAEITIPDSISYNDYKIVYRRKNSSDKKTEYITVASFEPAKFQTQIDIPESQYIQNEVIDGTFLASYLAGGPLSNADYELYLYKKSTTFRPGKQELSDYCFGPDTAENAHCIRSDEGRLDSNGQLSFSCSTSDQYSSGSPYLYNIEVRATDKSNQSITGKRSVFVHPASFYIGLGKLNGTGGFASKDQQLTIPVILTDTEGNIFESDKETKGHNKLKATFSCEYWTYNNQSSAYSSYYSRWEKHNVVDDTITVEYLKKDTDIAFTPKYSGWYTLNVEGSDENGRTIRTTTGFYCTGSSSYMSSEISPKSVKLTPDKSMYLPGDTAHILLESPIAKGDYLVTVERDGIFSETVKHLDSTTSIIDIKIAREFLPVAYVSVSSFTKRTSSYPNHSYGEIDFDKPHEIYGVTEIHVNPRIRAFNVTAEFNKEKYAPGEEAVIKLKATRNGEPVPNAELTIMGVDRAILDLINYHVPNPVEYFYNKGNFPLYVDGGDSRRYLMDPVTYSIQSLQGGDADTKEAEERKDFKPTAFFETGLTTDQNGEVTYKFKTPSNLTTFRMTSFGVKDDLLAINEDEFVVQKQVNVQAVQPKRLRVRDTAECGVLITNLTDETQNVEVEAKIDNTMYGKEDEVTGLFIPNGDAFIDGKNKCTLKVPAGKSTVAYFDVAATKAGKINIVYSTKCAAIKEKMYSSMEIEKSYSFETVATTGCLETVKKSSSSEEETVIIPDFAEDDFGYMNLTLDASRLGALKGAVDYVFRYPYGCMEQRSSKVLPLIIFEKYIDVLGLKSEVMNTKKVVMQELKYWKTVQKSSGGFPYWPSGDQENFYVSSRIAHICATGRKNGYSDKELYIDIDGLARYLKNNITSSKISAKERVYATYALTLLDPSFGDSILKEFFKNDDTDDFYVAIYAGLSYINKGKQEYSDEIAKCTGKILERVSKRGRFVSVKWDDSFSWYLAKSGYLSALMQYFVQLDPNDSLVDTLWSSILRYQKSGYWTSTATTSAILEGVATMIKARNLAETNLSTRAEFNGKLIAEKKFTSMKDEPFSVKKYFSDEALKSAGVNVPTPLEISCEGTGTLFYTLEMKYALPDEIQQARDNGFVFTTELYDLKTKNRIVPQDGLIYTLENGKTYKMKAKFSSRYAESFVALRLPVPSGANIVNSRFATTATSDVQDDRYKEYDSSEIRDNEVRFFWNYLHQSDDKNEIIHEAEFTFTAERRGVYPVPPAVVECMYESEVASRTDGMLYTIK